MSELIKEFDNLNIGIKPKNYCTDCKKGFRDNWALKRHLKNMKHNPEKYVKYTCTSCNYTTRLRSRMRTHCTGKKHRKKVASNDKCMTRSYEHLTKTS